MARLMNGSLPYWAGEGVQARAVAVDFAIDSAIPDELKALLSDADLYMPVQTIFVDNSLNTETLNIFMGDTGQLIKVPKASQGYFNVLGSVSSINTRVWGTAYVGVVRIIYISAGNPIPGQVWSVA